MYDLVRVSALFHYISRLQQTLQHTTAHCNTLQLPLQLTLQHTRNTLPFVYVWLSMSSRSFPSYSVHVWRIQSKKNIISKEPCIHQKSSILVKRALHLFKKTHFYQKSPTFYQKRTIFYQKSPTFYRRSPISIQKKPYSIKRALRSIKRDLHSIKRAPYWWKLAGTHCICKQNVFYTYIVHILHNVTFN